MPRASGRRPGGRQAPVRSRAGLPARCRTMSAMARRAPLVAGELSRIAPVSTSRYVIRRWQHDAGIGPDRAERRTRRPRRQVQQQPRHDGQRAAAVVHASERTDVRGMRAGDGKRNVASALEQSRKARPQRQRPPDDIQLEPPVVDRFEHLARMRCVRAVGSERALQRFQQRAPPGVVDRAPVVGIDEAEVPQLVALIDVRDAWRGQLEQRFARGCCTGRSARPRACSAWNSCRNGFGSRRPSRPSMNEASAVS